LAIVPLFFRLPLRPCNFEGNEASCIELRLTVAMPFKNHHAKTVWRAAGKDTAAAAVSFFLTCKNITPQPMLQSRRPNKSLPPPTNKALQHVCNNTSGACPSRHHHALAVGRPLAAELPQNGRRRAAASCASRRPPTPVKAKQVSNFYVKE
jgi:hypothetical protein